MVSQIFLALLTGLFAGVLFGLVQTPIPAPPNLPGILGIVGIFLGYKFVEWLDVQIDVFAAISGLF